MADRPKPPTNSMDAVQRNEHWWFLNREHLKQGEYAYIGGGDGMVIACPGCGKESYLALTEKDPHPRWKLSGSKDSPTLTPSVHSVGCCGWHGYLRNGRWESV